MATSEVERAADELWRQAAHLFCDCVRAREDRHLSLSEGAELAVHAAQLATRSFRIIGTLTPADQAALVEFLDHSTLVRRTHTDASA